MVYYLLVLLSIIISANASCMNRPCLAKEVIEYIGTWKNENNIHYAYEPEDIHGAWGLPWTISPTLIKKYNNATSFFQDLSNPEANTQVLPNIQMLKMYRQGNEEHYLLAEGFSRTKDSFYTQEEKRVSTWLFDGINTFGKAVICHKYNSANLTREYYKIFVITQSKYGEETDHQQEGEGVAGEGLLRSLMLEYDCNRIMYSVNVTKESSYKLFVDYIGAQKRMPIATCITDKLFVHTVFLGKETYLGIADEGFLYSIWLDDKKDIRYAKQTFSSDAMRFSDISVDHSIVTNHGFYPRIAFLTKAGEMFVTDLCEFQQPTLLYVGKIDTINQVKRFFYNQGKLLIFFDNANTAVHEYKDNFDILYGCALLKKLLPIDRD